MRLNKKFLVGFIFIYLLSLITLFPARILSLVIPDQVYVLWYSRTIWDGKVDLIIFSLQQSKLHGVSILVFLKTGAG